MHRSILALSSPLVLFSVLLGLGTVGMLTRHLFAGWLRFAIALGGGLLFEWLIVTPLWNFAMRFASKPALTLESAIASEATAVTSFDDHGQGIVRVELDGQIVQLLATLSSGERERGVKVRAGEQVRIEDIDPERNHCTVSIF